MVPEAFLPNSSIVSAFFTAIGIMIVILICVMAISVLAASFITIITYVICECICSPFFERYEFRDLALGRVGTHRRGRIITYHAIDIPDDDNRSFDLFDGLPSSIEERKALRKQALEKLLPPVFYESKETFLNSSECCICLDDYVDGESCRVFPTCNHMFHLKCIDQWLKNHLTCPVCRKCLLDPWIQHTR